MLSSFQDESDSEEEVVADEEEVVDIPPASQALQDSQNLEEEEEEGSAKSEESEEEEEEERSDGEDSEDDVLVVEPPKQAKGKGRTSESGKRPHAKSPDTHKSKKSKHNDSEDEDEIEINEVKFDYRMLTNSKPIGFLQPRPGKSSETMSGATRKAKVTTLFSFPIVNQFVINVFFRASVPRGRACPTSRRPC